MATHYFRLTGSSSRVNTRVIPPQMTVKTQTDAVAGPEPRDHHRCALLHSPFSPVWRRPACDRESASPSRHDGGSLDWVRHGARSGYRQRVPFAQNRPCQPSLIEERADVTHTDP